VAAIAAAIGMVLAKRRSNFSVLAFIHSSIQAVLPFGLHGSEGKGGSQHGDDATDSTRSSEPPTYKANGRPPGTTDDDLRNN
jgi:hypothetical protein